MAAVHRVDGASDLGAIRAQAKASIAELSVQQEVGSVTAQEASACEDEDDTLVVRCMAGTAGKAAVMLSGGAL